jgi:hypothetical protein
MKIKRNRLLLPAALLLLALLSCTQLTDDITAPAATGNGADSSAVGIILAQAGVFHGPSDSVNFTLNISKRGPFSFYMSNEYDIQLTQMKIRYLDASMPNHTGSFSGTWGIGINDFRIIFPAAGQYFIQLLPYFSSDVNKPFKILVSADTGTLLVPDPNESFPRQDTVSIGYFTDYAFNFHYFGDMDCYKFRGNGDSVTLSVNTLGSSYLNNIYIDLDLGTRSVLYASTGGTAGYSKTFQTVYDSTYVLRLYPQYGYTFNQFQYGFSLTY